MMKQLNISSSARNDDIEQLLAYKLHLTPRRVYLFSDATAVIVELFKYFYKPCCNLINAGHITPEIAIAADHAGIDSIESISQSPFSTDISAVLKNVKNPFDLILVANPNRITGSNYSLADLRELAAKIPNGVLIIDEYYYDYYGISGIPLLDLFTNVVIIRSFTASFGINSSDAGYMISDPGLINIFNHSDNLKKISPIIRKTVHAVLANEEAKVMRLKEVHEESLRLCSALNKIGISSRITATDSLLMRVASPKDVGNFLVSYKVAIENLDGYPKLQHYMRYRIESKLSNDRFLKAFEKMPPHYFKMKSKDRYAVTLKRGAEIADTNENIIGDDVIDKIISGRIKNRSKSLITSEK